MKYNIFIKYSLLSLFLLSSGYTYADDDSNVILALTDGNATLTAGTYSAGHVTYTRSGTVDKYGSFCLPFDFDMATSTCFKVAYTPIKIAYYNTNNSKLKLFLVTQKSVIKAGTPFIAQYATSKATLTNATEVSFVGTSTNPDPIVMTVFNYDGATNSSVLTNNADIKLQWCGTLTSTANDTRMLTFNSEGNFGTRSSTDDLSPFRAYLLKEEKSTSVKVEGVELGFVDDEETAIEQIYSQQTSAVFNLRGQKITITNHWESLPHGIYIINGKKVIK